MTCFALPNGLESPRLGIAASRKIGNAVTRNRAKRRVRELFRAHKPLKAIDIVFVPRREMVHAAWPDLEADYCAALQRIEKGSRSLTKNRPGSRFLLGEAVNSQMFGRCLRDRACRFVPTCSDYAAESIATHGALRRMDGAQARAPLPPIWRTGSTQCRHPAIPSLDSDGTPSSSRNPPDIPRAHGLSVDAAESRCRHRSRAPQPAQPRRKAPPPASCNAADCHAGSLPPLKPFSQIPPKRRLPWRTASCARCFPTAAARSSAGS